MLKYGRDRCNMIHPSSGDSSLRFDAGSQINLGISSGSFEDSFGKWTCHYSYQALDISKLPNFEGENYQWLLYQFLPAIGWFLHHIQCGAMACIICGHPFYFRWLLQGNLPKNRVGTHRTTYKAKYLGTTQPCLSCDLNQIPDAPRSWRSWFVLAGRGYFIPSMDHKQSVRFKGLTDGNSSRTRSVAAEGFEGTITIDGVLICDRTFTPPLTFRSVFALMNGSE